MTSPKSAPSTRWGDRVEAAEVSLPSPMPVSAPPRVGFSEQVSGSVVPAKVEFGTDVTENPEGFSVAAEKVEFFSAAAEHPDFVVPNLTDRKADATSISEDCSAATEEVVVFAAVTDLSADRMAERHFVSSVKELFSTDGGCAVTPMKNGSKPGSPLIRDGHAAVFLAPQ